VPENTVAAALYRQLGFTPTGEIEDGEVVLTMDLTAEPEHESPGCPSR
jgi:hypothetical protein